MPEPRIVACPTCGKPVEWKTESAWRPFCSERCKLIDFGNWADGNYSVPAQDARPSPDDLGQHDNSPEDDG